VVVDYSAPNIAKEMHVGHLRTTVIGDALARVHGFLGATVLRQNHLGDWGTQFGMLIQYLTEHPDLAWHDLGNRTDPAAAIATLNACYRAASARFDADEAFAERARRRVVALQAGDPETLAVWRELFAVSQRSFQALYDRLGVLLTPADAAGESSYNQQLAAIVEQLVADGVAVPSDGALCVFADGVTGPDGTPVPLIVRKSDGGFGYAVTDLAALRHRVRVLGADRILYVVDARQAMHFRMVFAAARRAGWLPERVEAVHVPFGTVLGTDGRPYRTRSGETVPLGELLDAAVDAARAVVLAKNPGLDPVTADRIAHATGIGAVKIADLSTSRVKDYVFDPDRMVSLSGDTGVYLQYAHARMRSILARVPDAPQAAVDPTLPLHPAERALALHLDGFGDALAQTADSAEPHRLCGYLFALAKAFTEFHGACHVLRADTPGQRGNRVVLCRLTADTLATGLGLLGVAAPDRL
jgi:arginyl-tRNA synthetase